ncbi:MAG: hypothetical protein H6R18_2761 [Proteobacteria bacterium]|nr:hypothetical protein [Pseudomonadota bacterium]
MVNNSVLEVRVSRKLLLVLTLVGLLFVAAGLEIGYFQKLLGPDFIQGKPIIKWIFLFVSLVLGGLISINCFFYLIFPPLMLRVTKETVTFAVGLRYKAFDVPAKLVERLQTFSKESDLEVNGVKSIVDGGVEFFLKNDPSIPSQMTTSMGVVYYNYNLRVLSMYANKSGSEIVEAAKAILKK